VLDTNGANSMTMVSPIHDGSCYTSPKRLRSVDVPTVAGHGCHAAVGGGMPCLLHEWEVRDATDLAVLRGGSAGGSPPKRRWSKRASWSPLISGGYANTSGAYRPRPGIAFLRCGGGFWKHRHAPRVSGCRDTRRSSASCPIGRGDFRPPQSGTYRFAKSTFYDVVPEYRPPPCLWRSKNQAGLLVAPLPRSSTVAPEAGREE